MLLRELLEDHLPRSLAFWRAIALSFIVLGVVLVLGGAILIVLEVRANLNGHSILPRRGTSRYRSYVGLTGLAIGILVGIAMLRVGWTELRGLKHSK